MSSPVDARHHPVVVVASPGAAGGDGVEALLALAHVLVDQGCDLEVALVDDGAALDEIRSVAPVLVVDHLRRTGAGRVALALGAAGMATKVKGWRLRRWATHRRDATWIVHPAGGSILGYAGGRPPVVVGAVLDPSEDIADLDCDGATAAMSVDLWIAATAEQRDELAALTDVETVVVGPLQHEVVHDVPSPTSDAESVLVVSPPRLGDSVDHATELIWQVASRQPDATFLWSIGAPEGQRLGRHDVHHLGLADRVTVIGPAESLARRARVVVRTGYAPTDHELVLSCALAGIPVIGFDLSDLPGAVAAATFDVEVLVDHTVACLTDRDWADAEGARLRDACRAHHRLDQRLEPLLDLVARSASRPPAVTGSGPTGGPRRGSCRQSRAYLERRISSRWRMVASNCSKVMRRFGLGRRPT